MSIYMLNKIRTEPEIFGFQSWPLCWQKRSTDSTNFWLWRQVPENWQVTRGFMLWLFLSWGIDYWTKNAKTKSGKFTFWNFCHPISHCAFAFMDEFLFISKSLGIFWIFLANFCGKWIFIFSFCSPAAQVSLYKVSFPSN